MIKNIYDQFLFGDQLYLLCCYYANDKLYTNNEDVIMSTYTVCIQLRHAEPTDYYQLSQKLKIAGFSRIITSGDGVNYRLPEAHYHYAGNESREYVRDLAYQTAESIKHDPIVLVTESKGRAWQGLDRY